MRVVSIVIPALNEADCLGETLASIPLEEFRRRGWEVEVLVVDNGSEDGTGDLARRLGARVVCEPRRGYGYALLRGLKEARGEVLCTLDADGTYPAHLLPLLVDRLEEEGLDFLNTDRLALMSDGAMSRRNWLGNRILSLTARLLYRLPFQDSQSGMWVFRKGLLDRMRLRSRGMSFSEEVKIEAWRVGARCGEVPIPYRSRRKGKSKLRPWRDGLGNLLYLLQKRFR